METTLFPRVVSVSPLPNTDSSTGPALPHRGAVLPFSAPGRRLDDARVGPDRARGSFSGRLQWFLLVSGTTSTARMPWASMGVFLFGTFVVALEKAGAAEHEELAGDG